MATILAVEDNADMRELMGFVIQRLGMIAKLAADMDEALAVFCEDANICVVLLDLGVPGVMTPEAFVETVRRLRPSHTVKFILASGRGNVASKASQLQADSFLFKPFGMSELRDAIVKTLESSR